MLSIIASFYSIFHLLFLYWTSNTFFFSFHFVHSWCWFGFVCLLLDVAIAVAVRIFPPMVYGWWWTYCEMTKQWNVHNIFGWFVNGTRWKVAVYYSAPGQIDYCSWNGTSSCGFHNHMWKPLVKWWVLYFSRCASQTAALVVSFKNHNSQFCICNLSMFTIYTHALCLLFFSLFFSACIFKMNLQ